MSLESLPVELLYYIFVQATSSALPLTSTRLYQVYKSAPPSVHAQYLLNKSSQHHDILSHLLAFPICSERVLEALFRTHRHTLREYDLHADLPRHLFRRTNSKRAKWSEQDHPLPWLRYLYGASWFPPPDPNAHNGYALIKAVYTNFVPLVSFLLDHGASPRPQSALAVMIAIRRRDLPMVRALIERDGMQRGKAKRRRMEDRVDVDLDMLKAAVQCGAKDIVRYFFTEKGCVPDVKTLQMMMAPPSVPLLKT